MQQVFWGFWNIRENTVISSLKEAYKKGIYLSEKSMRVDTQWSIDAMRTKTPTQETKIRPCPEVTSRRVILGRWASDRSRKFCCWMSRREVLTLVQKYELLPVDSGSCKIREKLLW